MLTTTELEIIRSLVGESFTLTKLAEKLKISKPALLKHLERMSERGLLEKTTEKTEAGRQSVYKLKKYSLFFSIDPASGSILWTETGSEFKLDELLLEQVGDEEFREDLHVFLRRLPKRNLVAYVILFGSVAEDKGTWKSDIDVALISEELTKKEKSTIEKAVADANMKTKHQVRPVFFTFVELENGKSQLVNEIKDNGLVIYGELFGRPSLWKQLKKYKNISR